LAHFGKDEVSMIKLKHLLLYSNLLIAIVGSAQEKNTLACPVEASILRKGKIKQLEISREDMMGKKEVVARFFIDKNGEATKKNYLYSDSAGTRWMKKEFKKGGSSRESVLETSVINADSTEKLIEKNTDEYDVNNKLIKRTTEQYKAQRIKQIDIFDPANPGNENQVILKFSARDTIEYRTTKKNISQKNYLYYMKRSGMWYESERGITKYTDGLETSYNFYKNGVLMNSWEKTKDQVMKEKEMGENPLPFVSKIVNDTLYTLDPKTTEYISAPNKKTYMVIRTHSIGSDKIIAERIYSPNGLLYSNYNAGETTKSVFTYK